MPRTRPPYPPEFREQMVELLKASRTPEELSREFEPTAQTIHNWVKQADLDTGVRSDGLPSSEREELRGRSASAVSWGSGVSRGTVRLWRGSRSARGARPTSSSGSSRGTLEV